MSNAAFDPHAVTAAYLSAIALAAATAPKKAT
jgi:hypothetical protein